MTSPLITLLAGPTASGKSALALDWAQRNGGLILNADSQQLYADLRVLTARPSAQDEATADHALYGIADAAEAWSVGRWTRAALPLIAAATGENRPVLLVGGTGLYFHALTRGLAEVPEPGEAARAAAATLFDDAGESVVRERLRTLDPAAEATIGPRDRQRLVRALAVAEGTGRPLSAWQAATLPLLSRGSWRGHVLEPDRAALYAGCDARAVAMIETGALAEVEALLARGLSPELPAMKAVGVRELATVIRGEASLDEALVQLQQATRNYAKRQLTWFRNQTPDWARIGPAGLEA